LQAPVRYFGVVEFTIPAAPLSEYAFVPICSYS
jgi:hypothetical protein